MQQHPPQVYLLTPLVFFLTGILVLAVGAFIALGSIRGELQRIEAAEERGGSVLDLEAGHGVRPSAHARLTWWDKTAVATFVIGVVTGVIGYVVRAFT
jgi:hypothetical protein